METMIVKYINDDYSMDLIKLDCCPSIIIENQGSIEDHLVWGINYNKNRKPLPKTVYKNVNNLKSSHIKKILEEVEKGMYHIPDIYIKTFNKILDERR